MEVAIDVLPPAFLGRGRTPAISTQDTVQSTQLAYDNIIIVYFVSYF